MLVRMQPTIAHISIHALREEGDAILAKNKEGKIGISIHALREEGDFAFPLDFFSIVGFLSTPSARRATERIKARIDELEFLSTPSARRATSRAALVNSLTDDFYPRPPRGGRQSSRSLQPSQNYFYPRPPRGGRPDLRAVSHRPAHFYPRPPRGGRRLTSFTRPRTIWHFYPRPPRGGRLNQLHKAAHNMAFLSTPSARRATWSASA